MFLFKKKKIVVDCFITHPAINELFPIQKASNFYPDWWKDLPKTFDRTTNYGLRIPSTTMKSCIGFTNLYTNGFMIPLWSDLIVETGPKNWAYEFSAPSEIHSHDPAQFGEVVDKYHHLKIESPWVLREKSGVKFVWMGAIYNQMKQLDAYHIIPGIIDYKYNTGTNINMLFPRVQQKVLIEAGTPLAHIIPMSDMDVQIKTHCVTEQELNKIETPSYVSSFLKKYTTNKNILESKERKCPFGRLKQRLHRSD